MDSRALDRLTAFTDAAVAIALTLLVLPLVDVAQEAGGAPLWPTMQAHVGDFLALLISFFVVMVFWRVHRRLFEPVRNIDETVVTLNSLWLLGVVFLPVPTAVLTFEGSGGAATLYLANLLFVSVAGLALNAWVWLRPRLYDPQQAGRVRRHLHRSVIVCGTAAIATGLSVPFGGWALLLLVVAPVAQRLGRRHW